MDIQKAHTASIHYGQKQIKFHITRQAHLQDKILIHVEPSGQVVVNAPSDSQQKAINCAVRKRARWIVRQLSAIEEYQGHVFPRAYVSGETHFYLGRRYILKLHPSPQEWVKMQQGKIIVALPSPSKESAKELLNYWYRKHAAQYLLRRLIQIAKDVHWLTAIPPMRLLRMRKQWGSCSPKVETAY